MFSQPRVFIHHPFSRIRAHPPLRKKDGTCFLRKLYANVLRVDCLARSEGPTNPPSLQGLSCQYLRLLRVYRIILAIQPSNHLRETLVSWTRVGRCVRIQYIRKRTNYLMASASYPCLIIHVLKDSAKSLMLVSIHPHVLHGSIRWKLGLILLLKGPFVVERLRALKISSPRSNNL